MRHNVLKFRSSRKPLEKSPPPAPEKTETVLNEEVAAVIGLALSMYLQDIHDYEKTVLTIQKVMRPYSPWSSKIYGLRQIPFKIPRQMPK